MMKAKHKNVSKNKTKKYNNDLQKQNTKGVKKQQQICVAINDSQKQNTKRCQKTTKNSF